MGRIISLFLVVFIVFSSYQAKCQQRDPNTIVFDVPGATATYVYAINDSMHLAGYYTMGGSDHGFYYDGSSITTIDFPGAVNTCVYGMNEHHDLVGAYNTTGAAADNEGFVYWKFSQTFQDVTSSWLSSASNTQAHAIDNSGIIAGDAQVNTTRVGFRVTMGGNSTFHYNYLPTYIYGMNENLNMVGFHIDVPAYHGMYRDGGGNWTFIDYPGNNKTKLYGINDNGYIVGTFGNSGSFVCKMGANFKPIKVPGAVEVHVRCIANDFRNSIAGYFKDGNNVTHGFYIPHWDVIPFRNDPYTLDQGNQPSAFTITTANSDFYRYDPYLGEPAAFPCFVDPGGDSTFIDPFFYPDWNTFVKGMGEKNCYTTSGGIKTIRAKAMEHWLNSGGKWHGSCFGLANTSYMAYHDMNEFKTNMPDAVDKKENQNKTTLRTFRFSRGLRTVVNMVQLRQLITQNIKYREKNWDVTPKQTLRKLMRTMLYADRDHPTLAVFAEEPGSGNIIGHALSPLKIEIDTLHPGTYKIFVYDCNDISDTTRFISVDTVTDTWTFRFAVNMGTSEMTLTNNKGLYLEAPSTFYYQESDGLDESDTAKSLPRLSIYLPRSANNMIYSAGGDSAGYVNGKLYNTFSDGVPITELTSDGFMAPSGYYLPVSDLNILSSGNDNGEFSAGLFDGPECFGLSRSNVTFGDLEKIGFKNSVLKLSNPGNTLRTYAFRAIYKDISSAELLFRITGIDLPAHEYLSLDIVNDHSLRISNTGTIKSFDLALQIISGDSTSKFIHHSIVLDANSSQLIVPEWNDLDNTGVTVYVDQLINGSNDDTLTFSNELAPEISVYPASLNLPETISGDTVYFANTGGGAFNWNVATDSPAWISFLSPVTGSNNGMLRFAAAQNNGSARTGYITITAAGALNTPDTIVVVQKGIVGSAALSASAGDFPDKVRITWTPVPAATHYRLYKDSITGGNSFALTGWITDTVFDDMQVSSGHSYYYYVVASQSSIGLNSGLGSNTDLGFARCFTADFTISNTCVGQPVYFESSTALFENPLYIWELDNSGMSDTASAMVYQSFQNTGAHVMKLKMINSNGCTDSITKGFNVSAIPAGGLGHDTLVCAGQSIDLTPGAGYASYEWSDGTTGAVLSADTAGSGLGPQHISVRVGSTAGCYMSDTVNVVFDVCLNVSDKDVSSPALSVFPNPAGERLFVNCSQLNDVSCLQIIAADGRFVMIIPVHTEGDHPVTIDISALADGFYLLRAAGENVSEVKKFMKN